MKYVVIVFKATGTDLSNSFPFDSATYFPSYREFIATAAEQGIEVRISYAHLYTGKSTFSGSFSLKNGAPSWDAQAITADCILIKSSPFSSQLDGSENVINRTSIATIAVDKLATYKLFSEYMLKTVQLDPSTVEAQVASMPGDYIVCKPVTGHGGKGIYVGPKSTFSPPHRKEGETYLLQEFLDTSKGIPGITSGIHDLRIILSGHEPLSYVRIPKPGTLLANLSQGGEARALVYDQIPKDALEIAQAVEQQLSPNFPHFYCADFLFGPDGKPVLCEINSQPGFAYEGGEGREFMKRYHNTLVKVLQEALALKP